MAQLQSTRLNLKDAAADSGQEAGLAFPATAAWVEVSGRDQNGTERKIHLIFGDGAPSTNYNNANLPSLYVDYTNYKLYIKTAASTWTVVGAQS